MRERVLLVGPRLQERDALDVIDGKVVARVYKMCKPIYPVRRVEISKTEVRRLAQIEIEEDWAADFAAPEPEAPIAEEVEATAEEGVEAPAEAQAAEEPEAEEEGPVAAEARCRAAAE